MRWGWSVVAGMCCAASLAVAQTPPANPIVSNFQAYRAALEHHDLAGAETAAAAALAASEARDGDGGHTAVLAFNLAQVRIRRIEWLAAQAPAARALALAQAHPDSGVDVHAAEMLVGESTFAFDWPRARAQVLAALAAVESRHDIDDVAYEAARELANFADGKQDYDTEETAWRAAILHAQGSEFDPRVAAADAKTSLAAAIVSDPGNRARESALREAAGLLLEVEADLWPLAQLQAPMTV